MKLDDRKVVELNLDDILPNRFQPRITFSESAINELSESIKEHGVIQPIVVRKINDKFEIIAGERRYKASVMAGKTTIPAIVTDLNDKESAEIALIENVQREDLTPIEEAVSYRKILDMGYLTQEELSSKLGKQQSTISNKLRLLNLDEEVQEALLEKKISERHARSLLRLEEKDQRMMLNRIITERLTVRKADTEIDALLNQTKPKEEVKEVEILDLDENDNKGENTMNENMNNNFNIPTSPIIEDNNVVGGMKEENRVPMSANEPSVMGSFNIPSAPIVEDIQPMEAPINPGFMDVDKIANTATDINVEKPSADLDSLLKPTPVSTNSVIEEPKPVDTSIFGFTPVAPNESMSMATTSEINNNTMVEQPGKFFNLGEVSEVNNNVEAAQTVSIPEISTPTSVPVTGMVEESTPVMSTESETTKSSMFGINLEPKNPDFISNVESKEANMNFDIPQPEVNTNSFNFDQFFTPDTLPTEDSVPVESVQPVAQVQSVQTPEPAVAETPIIENIVTPVSDVPSSTGGVAASVPPVVETSPVQESVQPVQTPAQPNYEVPSVDELDSFLNNLDSTTPLSNISAEMNPETDSAIVVPASVLETGAPMPTNNVQEKMDQVVAIIHEAKEKITALGVKTDVDEFDFDDMYQAIIKIDK